MSTVDAGTALHTTFIQRYTSTAGNGMAEGGWRYLDILNTHPTSDEHGKVGKSLYSPTGLGASATFLTPHSLVLPTDDAVSAPALTVVSGSPQPRLESTYLQS
jgi:hypothetical protein